MNVFSSLCSALRFRHIILEAPAVKRHRSFQQSKIRRQHWDTQQFIFSVGPNLGLMMQLLYTASKNNMKVIFTQSFVLNRQWQEWAIPAKKHENQSYGTDLLQIFPISGKHTLVGIYWKSQLQEYRYSESFFAFYWSCQLSSWFKYYKLVEKPQMFQSSTTILWAEFKLSGFLHKLERHVNWLIYYQIKCSNLIFLYQSISKCVNHNPDVS